MPTHHDEEKEHDAPAHIEPPAQPQSGGGVNSALEQIDKLMAAGGPEGSGLYELLATLAADRFGVQKTPFSS